MMVKGKGSTAKPSVALKLLKRRWNAQSGDSCLLTVPCTLYHVLRYGILALIMEYISHWLTANCNAALPDMHHIELNRLTLVIYHYHNYYPQDRAYLQLLKFNNFSHTIIIYHSEILQALFESFPSRLYKHLQHCSTVDPPNTAALRTADKTTVLETGGIG